MTPRQKEFCRHYTRGKSAKEAAQAAGYAVITCERNAARLLKSPMVLRRIERLRKAKGIVTIQDLQATRTEMMHTIQNSGDDRLKIWAANRLIQILKIQDNLDADAMVDQEEEWEKAHTTDNQTNIKTRPQLLDHQGNPIEFSNAAETPEKAEEKEEQEADLLPTGQPAFDLKLTPQKPEVIKPTTPVTVVFRPSQNPLSPPRTST